MKIGYFFAYFVAIFSTALLSAACESTDNTNVRTSNLNANTAVVVNATATPAARMDNANMTREEYDRNRAEYERENKGSSTIGQGANDSWIWFKTRTALATEDDLRDSTINVDVVNDMITLRGSVANAAQKAAAEKVAKSIEGQKGVKNQLEIKADGSMMDDDDNSNNSNRR